MKNLFIATIVACATLVTGIRVAKADVTYEKSAHVSKIVIRSTKSGYQWYLNEFVKPTTTLVKTCNGDRAYLCLYELKSGGKEKFLYKFRDDGWTVAFYDFRYDRDRVASR